MVIRAPMPIGGAWLPLYLLPLLLGRQRLRLLLHAHCLARLLLQLLLQVSNLLIHRLVRFAELLEGLVQRTRLPM